MKKFYSESGLIKNVVVGDRDYYWRIGRCNLSKGDLIEGNTIKADKLVIKGKMAFTTSLIPTDRVISEQTDYNSLNGTVIQAKSITADKVAVTDLVAFLVLTSVETISDTTAYIRS